MPVRFTPLSLIVLAGPLLFLVACQTEPAVKEPVGEFIVLKPPPKPAVRVARAKKPDASCSVQASDLTAARKEALFRQFAAIQGSGTDATPVAMPSPPAPPAPPAGCRQAAR